MIKPVLATACFYYGNTTPRVRNCISTARYCQHFILLSK